MDKINCGRLIIAGFRSLKDYNVVVTAMSYFNLKPTVVVSGKAVGVDTLGEQWAKENNTPINPYPVSKEDYNKLGKAAPHYRNIKMAENADSLLAIWDGKSNKKLTVYFYVPSRNDFLIFKDE